MVLRICCQGKGKIGWVYNSATGSGIVQLLHLPNISSRPYSLNVSKLELERLNLRLSAHFAAVIH